MPLSKPHTHRNPSYPSHPSLALKPPLKHPTKPHIKPSLPDSREGDAQWMRVMHTKETQWRFMNTLALHEINLLETKACSELDRLSARLDSLLNSITHMEALVSKCRAIRAREHFLSVASPPMRQLVLKLKRMPKYGYEHTCNAIIDSSHAIQTATNLSNEDLLEEIKRFRKAATEFGEASREHGLDDLVSVADMLDNLASVAAGEVGVVSCAAQAVADASVAAERRRAAMVDALVDDPDSHRPLVVEPSFVE